MPVSGANATHKVLTDVVNQKSTESKLINNHEYRKDMRSIGFDINVSEPFSESRIYRSDADKNTVFQAPKIKTVINNDQCVMTENEYLIDNVSKCDQEVQTDDNMVKTESFPCISTE